MDVPTPLNLSGLSHSSYPSKRHGAARTISKKKVAIYERMRENIVHSYLSSSFCSFGGSAMLVRVVVLFVFSLACVNAAFGTSTFVATLSGAQEAPTPVVSPGTGSVSAFHDLDGTLNVQVTFSGLSSPVTSAHIHCCGTPATSAGVAIDLGPVGFPTGVTSGIFSHLFNLNELNIYAAAFVDETQDLIPGATGEDVHFRLAQSMERNFTLPGTGTAYLNIHTENNPAGEIRGNFRLIPEPASIALLLCAAVGLCSIRRR
jgi:hypothetical protein